MTPDRAGLVVEMVGLPGCGKSTLSHMAAESLRLRGHPVREPTYSTDRGPSAVGRRWRKAGSALRRLLADPAGALFDLRAIRDSTAESLAGRAAGGLNWLYVAETEARASRGPGVHFLDQGVLQALWSVLYATGREGVGVEAWARRVGARIPPGTVAVIVEVPEDELRRRLSERTGGKSRLEAEIRAAAGAGKEPLARARAALAVVEAVAERLQAEGRVDVCRLDSGTAGADALARRLAALIEARIASTPRG